MASNIYASSKVKLVINCISYWRSYCMKHKTAKKSNFYPCLTIILSFPQLPAMLPETFYIIHSHSRDRWRQINYATELIFPDFLLDTFKKPCRYTFVTWNKPVMTVFSGQNSGLKSHFDLTHRYFLINRYLYLLLHWARTITY